MFIFTLIYIDKRKKIILHYLIAINKNNKKKTVMYIFVTTYTNKIIPVV